MCAFWATLASFGQLGLISDTRLSFQKCQNRLSDYKWPEKIYYGIVKHGETFYGRHTVTKEGLLKSV